MSSKSNIEAIPGMLFPYKPDEFWAQLRQIIRDEIGRIENGNAKTNTHVPGLTEKPLFKMAEVCEMFSISKPTVYEWVKHGKLKPYKIRSRVFFLKDDIKRLLT